jgi:hypothetical protein
LGNPLPLNEIDLKKKIPTMSNSRSVFDPEAPAVRRYIQDLNTAWKMRLYFWQKIPSLIFWGVRVKSADPYRCQVTMPYGWRTQNPFRSIYFAAQCGAAELSTGLLSIIATHGRGPISMLITGVEAEFVKKADSRTTFTCEEGDKILEVVQRAIDTGEGQEVTVTSTGVQESGEVVSRIRFRWSFKVKN